MHKDVSFVRDIAFVTSSSCHKFPSETPTNECVSSINECKYIETDCQFIHIYTPVWRVSLSFNERVHNGRTDKQTYKQTDCAHTSDTRNAFWRIPLHNRLTVSQQTAHCNDQKTEMNSQKEQKKSTEKQGEPGGKPFLRWTIAGRAAGCG